MANRRLIPAVFLLLGTLLAIAPIPEQINTPVQRNIRVEASQFSYDPGVIHVNPGDLVTIELSSMDSVHGLYLDGYGVSVTADPGKTQTLTFTADQPGRFRFRCNVTCGAMHPFMIGRLVVGRNDAFVRSTGMAALAVLFMFQLRDPSIPR